MRQHRSSTKSNDAHWSQRQRRAATSKDPGPSLPTLGGHDPTCWCGKDKHGDHPRPVPPPTPAEERKAAVLALQEQGICPRCVGKGCSTCLFTGDFPPPDHRRQR